MSASESQQPNQLPPQDEGRCETENFRGVYVFVDAVGDSTRRPADPLIAEWIRQHQYLLDPPPDQKKSEKN